MKNHKNHKAGDTVDVSKNEAFGIVDAGKGMIAKDMVESDMNTKEVKRGKSAIIRTHKRSRR